MSRCHREGCQVPPPLKRARIDDAGTVEWVPRKYCCHECAVVQWHADWLAEHGETYNAMIARDRRAMAGER